MIRRLVFVAVIAVTAVVPLGGLTPVFAQETSAEDRLVTMNQGNWFRSPR